MTRKQDNSALLIEGGDVVFPDRVLEGAALLAENGKIVYSGPHSGLPRKLPGGCKTVSARGSLVCPALWEPHIHGCGGNWTGDGSAKALEAMGDFLARQGVGVFIPTLISDERMISALGTSFPTADAAPALKGRMPGLYIEGPFVSAARRGAVPRDSIHAVSLPYLDYLVEKSGKTIRVMTIAPELSGASVLPRELAARGITPAIGHSDAKLSDLEGLPGGVAPMVVTHLFNGMSGISHREPGLAHWALLNEEVYTELICDGVHLHDAAIQLTLRARPWERIVLISDGVALAGLKDGEGPAEVSMYGGRIVGRGSGVYFADSGVLVGSRLLVRDGLSRLVSRFKLPVHSAVAMATLTPARLYGYSKKGSLQPGNDADIAVLSRDFLRCSFMSWEGYVLHESGA